jgi:hypothetical protein
MCLLISNDPIHYCYNIKNKALKHFHSLSDALYGLHIGRPLHFARRFGFQVHLVV